MACKALVPGFLARSNSWVHSKEITVTYGYWLNTWDLGRVSISDMMSYCKISWSSEAARFVSRIVQSLWNLTGTSAASLPMCLSDFKAMRQFKLPISWFRDSTRSYNGVLRVVMVLTVRNWWHRRSSKHWHRADSRFSMKEYIHFEATLDESSIRRYFKCCYRKATFPSGITIDLIGIRSQRRGM